MDALYRKVMAVRRPVVFRVRHLLYGWVHVEIYNDPICIYPEKSEDEVVALTDKLWASMSPRQRFLLSKKLFSRKWRTEV